MTKAEIKSQYSMRDIVSQHGLHPNRAGFISCPFHQGDRTASMKIYKDSFHCFGCGANGDIFTFTQKMYNCDFKTAFGLLGGTYEKLSKAAELDVYHARKAKEKRLRKKAELEQKIKVNNRLIGVYVTWIKKLEPLSDAWCDCQNALFMALYHDEKLTEELKILEGSGRY